MSPVLNYGSCTTAVRFHHTSDRLKDCWIQFGYKALETDPDFAK